MLTFPVFDFKARENPARGFEILQPRHLEDLGELR